MRPHLHMHMLYNNIFYCTVYHDRNGCFMVSLSGHKIYRNMINSFYPMHTNNNYMTTATARPPCLPLAAPAAARS
jgi:hypothetical protein